MQMIEIADEDDLFRRIVSWQMNPDGTVNSGAFKLQGKPDPSASVELAKLTTAEACLQRAGKPGLGVAALQARVPRAFGLEVRHDPYPKEDPTNEAHALIIGASTKEQIRKLAQNARVVIPPAAR